MMVIMTTLRNKYIGITHPIKKDIIKNKTFCVSWKISNCLNGIHAFNEICDVDGHYLLCDVCRIEVHIEKIIIPDGKDTEL